MYVFNDNIKIFEVKLIELKGGIDKFVIMYVIENFGMVFYIFNLYTRVWVFLCCLNFSDFCSCILFLGLWEKSSFGLWYGYMSFLFKSFLLVSRFGRYYICGRIFSFYSC